MNQIVKLPSRSEIKAADTWDLSPLFPDDATWESALGEFEKLAAGYADFQGKLSTSPQVLADCLRFDSELDRRAERLGNYAFLKSAEDQTNDTYQRLIGRFQNVAVKANEAASYIRPEILAIDEKTLAAFLAAPELAPYKLMLERLVRYKPHTLSAREEQLLAMQGEMAGAASRIFGQLHDADLKFGTVENEKGELQELSPATFTQFLQSPDREVRKNAFHQFYAQFEGHKHSLAAMLNGSIQKDVYYARARGYESARHQALFADNVPATVYDSLIAAVRDQLPALYRYYDLRKRKMNLDVIHHYDTYVPILSDLSVEHSWDKAVEVVVAALEPLGSEYCETLRAGLLGRWCDRYPNAGKQSGAFSSGGYDGPPYIMMNYKPKVLNDVFTLAHEAGHSMHTYLSAKHQPFEYYNYTIFVAEVASTFNEQLLSHHLLKNARDDRERANLLNNEIDDIRATVFRQTMFAEFEKITHEMAEAGEPLTVEAFRSVYRKLLEAYFGPDFTLDDELSLECLRIPHFYRAFYVYKYATGMSAAIALSQRVLNGGEAELQDYLGFLSGGCSKYPLDLLRGAGVDLERPEPVSTALQHFGRLVDELDSLL
ncbi:MAG: oligoendopeptidase F [Pirellulaceae bacterium]|nr:oligoendopeptidase F [Pirellulaceae bacterium]